VERETDGRIPAKRIFRTIEEKRKIVEEALKSPHSVAVVARQHGLNSNQLFGWRKLYLNGQLEPTVKSGTAVRLLPVSVIEDRKQEPGLAVSSNVTINIEIRGRASVSVEGQVSAEIIRVVLESLRGWFLPTGGSGSWPV
jgi:transposase